MQKRTLTYNHNKLTITYRDDSDTSVIDEFFVDRMYRSIESILSNIQYPIVDIGAHTGMFSIYTSLFNTTAQIIALEPHPDNFALLKTNIKDNHVANFSAKQMALIAHDDDETKLFISKDSHTHTTSPEHLSTEAQEHITVPAITLEKLIAKFNIEKIGLLKLDIEGAEFPIIRNTDQDTWSKIQYLIIEYHETEKNKRSDIENILRPQGFSIEHFPNHFDKRFGLLICRNKRFL